MDERIKQAAHECAIGLQKEDIEKMESAFIKGYLMAMDELQLKKKVVIDDLTYFDLGLPSGTLWSEPLYRLDEEGNKEVLLMPYCEAEAYDLPTYNDFKELSEYSMPNNRGPRAVTGANGSKYVVDKAFWLQVSSGTKPYEHITVHVTARNGCTYSFMGTSHAVVLIKKKGEL